MSAATYESVLHLADSLSRDEKLRLIRELAIRAEEDSGTSKERSVLELSGLGKEIWNGVDAQEYVSRERASWNG
ncbi:MAG: hypothetical protein WBD06_09920 [Acidobacteriaceae bacterium]